MTEDVAVTISWGPRAETAAECAERLRVSLSRIPTQRGVYSDWCVYPSGGADGPDDLLPASKDLDSLIELTEATVLRNDRGELMPGGGFSPLLTRLHRDRPVDYRVRCGVESWRLGNHGLLEFPHPTHADPISQDENVLRDALLALVDTWHPDHGSISTYPFRVGQKIAYKAKEIPIGWVTYLADSIEIDESQLPDVERITRVDGGVLLQLHGTVQEPSLDEAMGIRRALGYDVH